MCKNFFINFKKNSDITTDNWVIRFRPLTSELKET